jgi:hypothetical protein
MNNLWRCNFMFKLREAFAVSGAGCKSSGGRGGSSKAKKTSKLAGNVNTSGPAKSKLAGNVSTSKFPTSRRRASKLAGNV